MTKEDSSKQDKSQRREGLGSDLVEIHIWYAANEIVMVCEHPVTHWLIRLDKNKLGGKARYIRHLSINNVFSASGIVGHTTT